MAAPSSILTALSNLHSRDTEGDVDMAKELVSQTRVLQCGQFAVLALMVYDIIITMDKEAIVPSTYSWKVLTSLRTSPPINTDRLFWGEYLWINLCQHMRRVFYSLFDLDHAFQSHQSGLPLDCLVVICIEYALFLRARALYSLEVKDKKIARYAMILFVIEAAATFGIVINETIMLEAIAKGIAGFSYCASGTPSKVEWSFLWIIVLSYQIMMTSLCVYKATRLHRTLGLRGVHLVKVVVRNQLTYLSIIIICSIFNLIGEFDLNLPAVGQAFYLTIGSKSVFSLVGSRMLIHLKQAAEETPGEGGSLRLPAHPSTDVFRTISTRPESVPGQSQDTVQRTSEHGDC
ncbi:hypothetical protein ACEPAI_2149 [Sanghuangporus weigelae]